MLARVLAYPMLTYLLLFSAFSMLSSWHHHLLPTFSLSSSSPTPAICSLIMQLLLLFCPTYYPEHGMLLEQCDRPSLFEVGLGGAWPLDSLDFENEKII
jgi:hypothetical protein